MNAVRVDEASLRLPPSTTRHVCGARGKTRGVAGELRDLILDGVFSDDELIGIDRELIQHFGGSRPTLREALRILEGESLLTVNTGIRGGVFARPPSARSVARASSRCFEHATSPSPTCLPGTTR